MVTTGCQRGPLSTPSAAPRASVALRVLVVNEPGLAEAINRLRGEWAERSGGELSAEAVTWSDVSKINTLDADAIVFPSRYLGEMCVRGWLRRVRPNVLESDDFNADDVFPLVRRELIKWGGDVMALPLGVDIAMAGRAIGDHPGIGLLAQAAPKLVSSEREGFLFDPQTMKPRISEAVFVAALQRLVESKSNKFDARADFTHLVPVFGFSDRLVAVSTASRNGASAFKLIAWLASAETSTQLASAGQRMMPVRRSFASSSAWYGDGANSDERRNVVKMLTAALSGDKCLLVPRIPGVDEYLAALDDAVRSAISGKVPPRAALEKVAARWEHTTIALGRDSQRQSYLKHLGITER